MNKLLSLFTKKTDKDALTLYVNPSVKEKGDGSKSKPFATVMQAYFAAKAYLDGEGKSAKILLSDGTYVFEEELKMDTVKPLTVMGEKKNGGAVLTGAKNIKGSAFSKVEGKPYYVYQLPDEAKKDGKYPKFRDLYLNGKSMKLCGTKEGAVFPYDTCANIGFEGAKAEDRLLYVKPEMLDNALTDSDNYFINEKGERTTIEMWIRVEWQVHCIRIEQICENKIGLKDENGVLQKAVKVIDSDWELFLLKGTYYSTLKNRTYWFRNSLAYLENNGDFYYDNQGGLIYLCTDLDMSKATVSYPAVERILNLSNSENLTLENLEFWGATENFITDYGYIAGQAGRIKSAVDGEPVGFLALGAIYANNAKNVTVHACRFHDVGSDAVNFRGAVDNVTVSNCYFKDISGTAVRFGMANRDYNEEHHNKDINIVNNYMENIGTVFISNPSVVVSSVLNLKITKNTILDSAYSAISVGFCWKNVANEDPAYYDSDEYVNIKNADISYNFIKDFMMRMRDGGAIYVLGGNATFNYTKYLNSMNNNYVVMDSRIGEYTDHWTVYYHDEGSSHWYDYDNVIVREANMQFNTDSISYQTVGGEYSTTRCKTVRTTIIGYPFEDEKKLKDTCIGKCVFGLDSNVTSEEIKPDRCYKIRGAGEDGALKFGHKYAEDIVIATSFEDLTKEINDRVKKTYEGAGSDITAKPFAYGIQPKTPKN